MISLRSSANRKPTTNDSVDGENENTVTDNLISCWSLRNRLYQKFRKRFDLEVDGSKSLNEVRQKMDDTLNGSNLHGSDNQAKNWRYHLTSQHF